MSQSSSEPSKENGNQAGPATKQVGTVFYNPAMAGSRTRSVLLMRAIIDSGFLGDKEIYAIDGLSASGIRARRWLNELPSQIASRLRVTICDMDEISLEGAMNDHQQFPPEHGMGELLPRIGDMRTAVLDHGRHWVDIDPFGSPLPFLDTAIQSLARRGILEVSATDTAALTGSSKTALLRRYGARVKTDGLCHDSGLRVLLANIARAAARHDRVIEPILSIWDSHHLRVSLKVTKSIEGANLVEEKIGWRIAEPTEDEVRESIEAGLSPPSDLERLPMHCLLPLTSVAHSTDKRISGPLWIGKMGCAEIMSQLSEEAALRHCSPILNKQDIAGWSEKDVEFEKRKIARSVRHIANEAGAIHGAHLIPTDDLASWLGANSPPSPQRLVDELHKMGHCAARAHYGNPAIRTDAPWSEIVQAVENI